MNKAIWTLVIIAVVFSIASILTDLGFQGITGSVVKEVNVSVFFSFIVLISIIIITLILFVALTKALN